MSEKISLCGNDCLKCPRYLAKTEDELAAVAEHGVERCGRCAEFPCEKINSMLARSEASRARCMEVCTPEEFRALEESSFRKLENLTR